MRGGITDAFRATLAITDSEHIWALRWSSDDYAPSLFVTHKSNGALIVSEPLDKNSQSWQKVPANSLVRVDLSADGISVDQKKSFVSG